jgi:peptide-methionine (S)-S-oxide reductase
MKVLQLPGYIAFILALSINACAQPQKKETTKQKPQIKSSSMGTETITFGSGCFWCTEAIFQQVKGVEKVVSGYSGGHVVNPTYEQVCEKNTGHAEVCQLTFDPSQVSVDELLEIFWQYRSVVFYHNENQKERAEFFLNELSKSGAFEKPIVTTIEPYKNFYKAENYHQNYYNQNGSQPYCYFVIRPKVEKFEKAFKDKMKPKQ